MHCPEAPPRCSNARQSLAAVQFCRTGRARSVSDWRTHRRGFLQSLTLLARWTSASRRASRQCGPRQSLGPSVNARQSLEAVGFRAEARVQGLLLQAQASFVLLCHFQSYVDLGGELRKSSYYCAPDHRQRIPTKASVGYTHFSRSPGQSESSVVCVPSQCT
jgi:hypothetical protein